MPASFWKSFNSVWKNANRFEFRTRRTVGELFPLAEKEQHFNGAYNDHGGRYQKDDDKVDHKEHVDCLLAPRWLARLVLVADAVLAHAQNHGQREEEGEQPREYREQAGYEDLELVAETVGALLLVGHVQKSLDRERSYAKHAHDHADKVGYVEETAAKLAEFPRLVDYIIGVEGYSWNCK